MVSNNSQFAMRRNQVRADGNLTLRENLCHIKGIGESSAAYMIVARSLTFE